MKALLAPVLILLSSPAMAHGLHDSGDWISGFLHPLNGADHMLAMVAVGLLAARIGGKAAWALPLAFLFSMASSGLLAGSGLSIPLVEPMILASVVILGLLLALATGSGFVPTLPMVALFGLSHGAAHVTEGPPTGTIPYAVGFLAGTAILHLAGIMIGKSLPVSIQRGLGLATAGCGLALAWV